MSAWGYTRHYLCLKILYSITTEFATVGPFEINWETQQYKCRLSQVIAFSLLAALQAVNLYWWFLICRIAYRFVVTKEVDDERSEYEDSEAEEEGEKKKVNLREFERKKKEAEKKLNGVANGTEKKMNGAANGTPKLLINGEDPSAPELFSTDNALGSDASKLRERKKASK
jgi:acyl-CoA-dependent ceramide synthase